MHNKFNEELITLIDEENNEYEFEILDIVKNKEGIFYALTPVFAGKDDSTEDESTYYIFESVEENGEERLAEVEDNDLLDKLAVVFESRFVGSYSESSEI
ncbi:MAG: DUF1292 domain-containing protein [Oscillospiraceae bacterium]|nr:DUF1292 domain-containing protein [Oscillospiraceae bacterium]